jgi:hypothetical protein
MSRGIAMSDRLKLAREIAARTDPRFIDTMAREDIKDLKALAREIAARKPTRFVTIHRHRGGSPVFTEVELTAKRGGLTAEEYRSKTIRKWLKE